MNAALVWLNTIVFAACLPYLGVPFWKAAVVAVIAAVCTHVCYGGRWVSRIGFVMLGITLGIWTGFLPVTQEWPDYLRTAKSMSGLASLDSGVKQELPERFSTGSVR
jgi:hypothetical protein